MSNEKLMSKIEGEINKSFMNSLQIISDKISETGFPQDMICSGSTESKKAIFEWITSLNENSSSKKASPRGKKSPSNEALWMEPKKLIIENKKQEHILDEWDGEKSTVPDIILLCPHNACKGKNRGLSCGKKIPLSCITSKNIHHNVCSTCSKNNTEKAKVKRQDFYESLLAGSEVKGSPTGNYNVPADEVPEFDVAEMAGIKDGVTSPTGPKGFLKGKASDVPSPSGARVRVRSPKNFPIDNIEPGKTDDYQDCYGKKSVNGCTWLIRKTFNPTGYILGGKFPDDRTDFDENYLEDLIEIEEDENETVSKIGITYTFLGDSASSGNRDDDDDDEDEIDDLIANI